MKRFVLDASVTLAWFIDPLVDPVAQQVQRFLLEGDHATVPPLWRTEIANGFVISLKHGTLTPVRIAEAIAEIDILLAQSIESFTRDLSLQRVVTVAQNFALTAYDATYLEIARELQLPLATLDRKLAAAAQQAGVGLVA